MGMESSAPRYHLEINGIAEGPMTARELTWKIGRTSGDDVVLFRRDGSANWLPLEGNRSHLLQLAAVEAAAAEPPASPPKLKLKKREDATTPVPSETPPPFPTEPAASTPGGETPPPPPGAPGGVPLPESLEHADDNPPPPPGAPGYPSAPAVTPPPTPQLHSGTPAPPATPSAPPTPPIRLTTLLTVSFVVTLALAGYIFFLMPQDVTASAKRKTETSYTREISGLNYVVLTKDQAEAWKASALEKLTAFGAKAKAEAAASAGRSVTLTGPIQEIIAKHTAGARALSLAGINAKNLSYAYDPKSPKDVKALRSLELAMEIAEAYLPPACRGDMDGGRFSTVALAVRGVGFTNLQAAFEAEILPAERRLKAELAQLKPTADEAKLIARSTMYAVPSDINVVARGTSDTLGRLDLRLTPGDYVIIATAAPLGGAPAISWARRFKVKALAENDLSLDDSNVGTKGAESLWKAAETLAIEREIVAAVEQAGSLEAALHETQKLRDDIDEIKIKVGRMMDN